MDAKTVFHDEILTVQPQGPSVQMAENLFRITDFTFSDIASHAGFGSVRDMRVAFKAKQAVATPVVEVKEQVAPQESPQKVPQEGVRGAAGRLGAALNLSREPVTPVEGEVAKAEGTAQKKITERVGRAKRFLEREDLPLEDVARKAGYQTLGQLRDEFMSVTEMSPEEYRTEIVALLETDERQKQQRREASNEASKAAAKQKSRLDRIEASFPKIFTPSPKMLADPNAQKFLAMVDMMIATDVTPEEVAKKFEYPVFSAFQIEFEKWLDRSMRFLWQDVLHQRLMKGIALMEAGASSEEASARVGFRSKERLERGYRILQEDEKRIKKLIEARDGPESDEDAPEDPGAGNTGADFKPNDFDI